MNLFHHWHNQADELPRCSDDQLFRELVREVETAHNEQPGQLPDDLERFERLTKAVGER